MAIDVLRLKKEEFAFAAFAAWDVAGSKAYGYSTFWVNRMRVLPEHLGGVADFSDETLEGLLRLSLPNENELAASMVDADAFEEGEWQQPVGRHVWPQNNGGGKCSE